MKKRAVLPRSIPFIDAVFRVAEGKATREHAADMLAQAEKKFGLNIRGDDPSFDEIDVPDWLDSMPPIDVAVKRSRNVMDVPQPRPLPEIDEMDWKRRREEFQSESEQEDREFEFTPSEPMRRRLEHEGTLVDRHLYPFMGHTGFIVTGENFSNDHDILFADGTTLTWSWRGWGALVANWANHTEWLTPLWDDGTKVRWDYMDFYMGDCLNDLIEGWDEWYDAFLTVLRLKCSRPDSQRRWE